MSRSLTDVKNLMLLPKREVYGIMSLTMDTLNEYIQPGKRFELLKQGADGSKERYVSRFLSKSSGFITIDIPQYGGKICKLSPNEDIELYVYTQQGIFCLECKVIKFDQNTYHISYPLSSKHSQRREFLRVNKHCRANIQIYKPNGTMLPISALTYDICGGGIGLMLDSPIGDYSKIKVQLLLDEQTIETLAEVVYTKLVHADKNPKYHTALMFISVANKEVDAIVKECLLFQLQEKSRRLKNQN